MAPQTHPALAQMRPKAPQTRPAPAQTRPTALLLFLPSRSDAIESELATAPTLSIGLLSATQGNYNTAQLLLDITQGARVSHRSPALRQDLRRLDG
jgi:hypothetical protein